MGVINRWVQRVHGTAVEKGWWEARQYPGYLNRDLTEAGPTVHVQRQMPELLMLVVSEVSEALEDYRNWLNPEEIKWSFTSVPTGVKANRVYFEEDGGDIRVEAYDGQEVIITPDNAAQYGFVAKPYGIPVELADVIIRVMDICGHYGIDLESAMLAKHEYNESREHRHGGKKA